MITNDQNNVLMFKQILSTSTIQNILKRVRGICMLILGVKRCIVQFDLRMRKI